MKSRKSISPVIATILLITIVVVLALIIFLWATKFVEEAVTKNNVNAEQACGEVSLEASYIGSELQVINTGRVYLYRADVIKTSQGNDDKNPEDAINKLGIGNSEIKDIGAGYDEVKVVPVILGLSDDKKVAYTCRNNIFKAE